MQCILTTLRYPIIDCCICNVRLEVKVEILFVFLIHNSIIYDFATSYILSFLLSLTTPINKSVIRNFLISIIKHLYIVRYTIRLTPLLFL
jgi:hypothetical protein